MIQPHLRYRVEGVEQSCAATKTFNLMEGAYPIPKPGQFYMVWLPGVSENPISASGRRSITVRDVGARDERSTNEVEVVSFSHAMMALQPSDYLMMRGPLGHGFRLHEYAGDNICVIGFGCGAAPLRYLVSEAQDDTSGFGARITGIISAKTADQLLFAEELEAVMDDLVICTDDGSRGHHGFATKFLDRLGIDDDTRVYVCGPEVAMAAAAKQLVGEGVKPGRIQLLLESRMKCGDGVCGACGPKRVCKKGPALPYDVIMELPDFPDFGERTYDASGAIMPIKGAKN